MIIKYQFYLKKIKFINLKKALMSDLNIVDKSCNHECAFCEEKIIEPKKLYLCSFCSIEEYVYCERCWNYIKNDGLVFDCNCGKMICFDCVSQNKIGITTKTYEIITGWNCGHKTNENDLD